MGHEYQFPPANLSARCGFSKQTFAGMGGKEEDAPIPAVRLTMIDRLKSTKTGPWRKGMRLYLRSHQSFNHRFR